MSLMVERVAKKIHFRRGKMPWPDKGCRICLLDAKAAIAAMREPTEEMVKAGYDNADGSHLWREVWKVMIDAALKD